MQVEIQSYGQVNGIDYDEIIIRNQETEIGFSNLGARITRWRNKDGSDIILALADAPSAFAHRGYYYGTTVGRVAGRIAKGQFRIGNQSYQLDTNEAENHLHGGSLAFDLRTWQYQIDQQNDQVTLTFTLEDKAGNNGYPGDMRIKVKHSYDINHNWRVEYEATSDQATLFNPTNHVYFNLNGNLSADIRNHRLTATVSEYAPVQADGIPLGHLIPVSGTPFDLRQGQTVGTILQSKDPQVQLKSGYDHAFKFEQGTPAYLCLTNGDHVVQIHTDTPAVVIYTHAFAQSDVIVNGQTLYPYAGIAIETQALPDAINQLNFGNIILEPHQVFKSWTSYQWIK